MGTAGNCRYPVPLKSQTDTIRPMNSKPPSTAAVITYLRSLHDSITSALEQADGGAKFRRDSWERPEGGGGESRVLREGAVFEQAGINFSHVMGGKLPASATAQRPELAGASFEATGRAVNHDFGHGALWTF